MNTVLIIEDDEATRSVYQFALSERGYRVLLASHGAEGVHLARTQHPDLILLDIVMPVMDGLDAMRHLKQYRETQSIPVCAISAYTPGEMERERIEGLAFDCFLLKPIGLTDLLNEVEARIGPPGDTPSQFIPQPE